MCVRACVCVCEIIKMKLAVAINTYIHTSNDDHNLFTDDSRRYHLNYNLSILIKNWFIFWKIFKMRMRKMKGRETSVHRRIIVTYACVTFMPFSGSTKQHLTDKHCKITDDHANCRFYFKVPSLRFFLPQDTYKSTELWCRSFVLQFWFWS